MGGIMMPFMGSAGQQGYVTPNTIPSLSLWYNASASSTIVNGVNTNNFNSAVVNGTSVSAWNDLTNISPAANVQGGASRQPTYAIPVQNSLGSVQFNSANSNNLDINPVSWAQTLSGFTIYTLAKPTNLPATLFPLTVSDTSLGVWWNGTNWSVGQSAGNLGTVTVTNDTSKFHIYGMVFDGTQSGNANRLKFRYDGADKALTYTGTVGANTGAPAYYFFGGNNRSAGAGGATNGTFMTGYMGEVMIWTRTLTASEQLSVELYLNTKWNLGLV